MIHSSLVSPLGFLDDFSPHSAAPSPCPMGYFRGLVEADCPYSCFPLAFPSPCPWPGSCPDCGGCCPPGLLKSKPGKGQLYHSSPAPALLVSATLSPMLLPGLTPGLLLVGVGLLGAAFPTAAVESLVLSPLVPLDTRHFQIKL